MYSKVRSDNFSQMYCVDKPEDIVFFGEYGSSIGVTYEIILKECTNSAKCMPAAKRKTYLENYKPQFMMLLNKNTY